MIEVILTPEQELEGAREGFERQENAVKLGLKTRHHTQSLWCAHIEGACSELAVSIALNQPWSGKGFRAGPGQVHPADVGEAIEVRQVVPGKREPLLGFDPNRDEKGRWYVLVVGFTPRFVVVGRILGTDCQREEWKVVYPERTIYRVPASALIPIEPT